MSINSKVKKEHGTCAYRSIRGCPGREAGVLKDQPGNPGVCDHWLDYNGTSKVNEVNYCTQCGEGTTSPNWDGSKDDTTEVTPIEIIAAAIDDLTGIEAFCIGNSIRYLLNWNTAPDIEDLKKASWYLSYIIYLYDNGYDAEQAFLSFDIFTQEVKDKIHEKVTAHGNVGYVPKK